MPRTECVLTIFLASPSDVQPERETVELVIREMNQSWSSSLGLRLELVRWETHVRPGLGDDAQDVINRQVPPDFDLFIGIMWHRFGTPTNRAASGTYEEFQLAKARRDNDPEAVDVMFYFKDEAVAPHALDVKQLAQVQNFRSELGTSGYYAVFSKLDEFEKKVRSHLSLWAQKWVADHSRTSPATRAVASVASRPSKPMASHPSLDLGILECQETIESEFERMTQVMSGMSEDMRSLNDKLTGHTARIGRITRESEGNREMLRLALRDAATDLNAYADSLEVKTATLTEIADNAYATLKQFIVLWPSLHDSQSEEGLEQARAAILGFELLRDTLVSIGVSVAGFRASVDGTPPLSTELIKAKGRVSAALESHIKYLESAQQQMNARIKELRSVVEPGMRGDV